MFALTPKGQALVFKYEGCDNPGQFPGGDSGCTLGYGYDIGYESRADFLRDWSPYLQPGQLARLSACCGLKGNDAAHAALKLNDIRILPAAARAVFNSRSVPKYWKQALSVFPGADTLPPDARSAIWSLVFNRGASLEDSKTKPASLETRREMRAIAVLIAEYAKPGDHPRSDILKEIAAQIRSMKRLVAPKMGGLLLRRDAEADLVLASLA